MVNQKSRLKSASRNDNTFIFKQETTGIWLRTKRVMMNIVYTRQNRPDRPTWFYLYQSLDFRGKITDLFYNSLVLLKNKYCTLYAYYLCTSICLFSNLLSGPCWFFLVASFLFSLLFSVAVHLCTYDPDVAYIRCEHILM